MNAECHTESLLTATKEDSSHDFSGTVEGCQFFFQQTGLQHGAVGAAGDFGRHASGRSPSSGRGNDLLNFLRGGLGGNTFTRGFFGHGGRCLRRGSLSHRVTLVCLL